MSDPAWYHLDCGTAFDPPERGRDEDPPDPDWFGNRHVVLACPTCGEKLHVTFPRVGGKTYSEGFVPYDEVDFAVPLPEA